MQKGKDFTNKRFHLVGIKGVGMTPLAIMLKELGNTVTGSDTLESQITDEILRQHDISVTEFSPDTITQEIDVVVYSGAYMVSRHPELQKAEELMLPLASQAMMLAELVNTKDHIAVCGVGGKTTTSGMGATVFNYLGYGGWFSGVSKINGTLPGGHIDDSELMIVEADEYAIATRSDSRPKFALYNPKVIICTHLAHDHPDIYESFDKTLDTFAQFFNRLPDDGALIINPRDLHLLENRLNTKAKVITFAEDPTADWCIKKSGMNMLYNLFHEDQEYQLNMSVIGTMNAENATALVAACDFLKLDIDEVLKGITEFKGTKRRLEIIREENNILYMDDYGHHPDEINVTLSAIKNQYPDKRLVVIFHPHTLSRTSALLEEFGNSFVAADQILLAPIFASAREYDDGSVSLRDLHQAIESSFHKVESFKDFDAIAEEIKEIRKPGDIILTLGAGDVYKVHEKL